MNPELESSVPPPEVAAVLDVRGMKCPLNFVQTKLKLEKMDLNAVLEVWVDAESQSVLNIPQSIQSEGHQVVFQEPFSDEQGTNMIRLGIKRLK